MHERDRESVINNPNSLIVDIPKGDIYYLLLSIFHSTQKLYDGGRLSGYDYLSLKDLVKWNGLKPKRYIPTLIDMMKSYMNGILNRNGD